MIPTEYRGKKFLQNVEEIRYTRGGVASNQVTLHREVEEGNRNFVEAPPTISFHDDADIDIERLLRVGAITPYTVVAAAAAKEEFTVLPAPKVEAPNG